MVTRGSLRQMIEQMADMFKRTNAKRLAIYQVRGGKYYNLTDEDKLHEWLEDELNNQDVSFLCLTHREFLSMFKSNQSEMFPENDDD